MSNARSIAPAAIAILSLAACGDATPRAEARDVPAAPRDTATLSAAAVELGGFTLDSVTRRPWHNGWVTPARLVIDPDRSFSLGAIAEGRVTRVLVRPGDAVRKGDVLVAIHSHEMMDARGALAQARARVTDAHAAREAAVAAATRAERLHALRALSTADLERARADRAAGEARANEADAELARARAMVDHLVGDGPTRGADEHEVLVRAPIDGVVVDRTAQPGTVVVVGTPLVTVGRPDALMLALQLPEEALAAARPGAEVRFTVRALPGARFTARLTRVAPALDATSRTVEAQAAVVRPDARLRAEMYVEARLVGPAGDTTLVVPLGALQALEGDTVLVASEPRGAGMHIEAVPVRAGRRDGELVEIRAGATAGMRIINGGAAIAKAELLERRGGA